MPDHPRKLIRHAMVAALTNATAAGPHVAATRISPFRQNELPAIAVYSLEEANVEEAQSAPREFRRVAQLAVEAATRAPSEVDDELDDLALEIETAVLADDTLGGTCDELILASTEFDFSPDGNQPIGVVRLTFDVTYRTSAPVVAPVLDAFRTADVRYPTANDRVTVSED